jgi:hypothetical protein
LATANEEATEIIDLDAPAAEPVKQEEEVIQVEEVAAEAPEAEAKTE